MAERKYTLVEATAALFLGGILGALIFLAIIPLDLGLAWMRTQVWNWFLVPYFHAPHVTVWPMFALILFISMWCKGTRELKSEIYSQSTGALILGAWLIDGITFVILYGVHIWILKG